MNQHFRRSGKRIAHFEVGLLFQRWSWRGFCSLGVKSARFGRRNNQSPCINSYSSSNSRSRTSPSTAKRKRIIKYRKKAAEHFVWPLHSLASTDFTFGKQRFAGASASDAAIHHCKTWSQQRGTARGMCARWVPSDASVYRKLQERSVLDTG